MGLDKRLHLQLEALTHLDQKEREGVETVIVSVLHVHDAYRWRQAANAPSPAPTKKAAGSERSAQASSR